MSAPNSSFDPKQVAALAPEAIEQAVAEALTKGLDTLPHSAWYAIAIGAVVGIILPILERLFPKARPYLPSAMGLGLAWVVSLSNSMSFAVGAVIAWIWSIMAKPSAERRAVVFVHGATLNPGGAPCVPSLDCAGHILKVGQWHAIRDKPM